MINSFARELTAAARVSVPIVSVQTADPAATIEQIRQIFPDHPVVQWDTVRGITVIPDAAATAPDAGREMLKAMGVAPDQPVAFIDAMTVAKRFPETAIICCHAAHRQLLGSDPNSVSHNVQAVANLRDEYKRNHRMVVLLAPSFNPPPELSHDIVTIIDPLPDAGILGTIVTDLHESAGLAIPEQPNIDRAVTAVSGLSQFAAEQAVALSLTTQGLDYDRLWNQKQHTIEATRGLRVHRGGERFDDLVGLEPLKAKLRSRATAKTPVGVVVFVDEIDKVLANVESDTTGVRQDQLKVILQEMEDNEWQGLVCVGVPGAGKSAIAKAFGKEVDAPTISLDLGDMEAPHVGESEAMIRQAFAVIKAVGQGNAFFVATSNHASSMRPELQRRFNSGFWFFDLMTSDQRDACWQMYMAKYELDAAQPRPDDTGWTGAEIRNACREAWETNTTIMETAQFIVPMATSRGDEIEKLRHYASGRFLDANKPGPYQYVPPPEPVSRRAVKLGKETVSVN